MSANGENPGFSAAIAEVDRMLQIALKKNLRSMRHLATTLPDGPEKENLERLLKKHPLSRPEKTVEQPAPAPSETMKRQSRINRYIEELPEENFETVLDLVKSLCRRKKGLGGEGGSSDVKPPKRRGRRKKALGGLGNSATSDASSANALDSSTEEGKA